MVLAVFNITGQLLRTFSLTRIRCGTDYQAATLHFCACCWAYWGGLADAALCERAASVLKHQTLFYVLGERNTTLLAASLCIRSAPPAPAEEQKQTQKTATGARGRGPVPAVEIREEPQTS